MMRLFTLKFSDAFDMQQQTAMEPMMITLRKIKALSIKFACSLSSVIPLPLYLDAIFLSTVGRYSS